MAKKPKHPPLVGKTPTKKSSKDSKKKLKAPTKKKSKNSTLKKTAKTARKTATPRPVKKIAKFGSSKKKASAFVAPSKKLKKKKSAAPPPPSVRVDNSDLANQQIFVPHRIFPKEKKPALGGWSAICTSVNGQRAYVSFPGYENQKYFFSPDLVRQWMNDVRSKQPKGVSLKKKHALEQPEDDNEGGDDDEEEDDDDDEEGEVIGGSDDDSDAEEGGRA